VLDYIASHPINYYYDSGTAESIDERSAGSPGGYYALTYFAGYPVNWTQVRVYNNSQPSGIAIRSAPHDFVNMYSLSLNYNLAHSQAIPGSDTTDSFQDVYDNCGSYGN
jgi:hypothetical protein